MNYLWNADNGDGTYTNPVLYTDYSDPDVVRVGDLYYMVASSFCNTPAIPVLVSSDLVNWKLLSYVLEQIPEPGYEIPRHGHGVWAPAIRYHDGLFYVYYPMPDEGIFVCTAKDPGGPWDAPVCVRPGSGWIDPCPFWDEDGQAWLVNGFAKSRTGFKSILHMSPMAPDGKSLLSEGRHIFDGSMTQPTIEGPKLYKRNGWYYIFAPAGTVKGGWQTVLRSRDIYGPYEERIVMLQGDTKVNGPHQGAWVDTPFGEDWFIHFQDVGNAGRIVHLQPLVWVNDWPIIGKDGGDGYGTPVRTWKKPRTREDCSEKISPPDSDSFRGERLGLQWQWNANHLDSWYRMEKPGLRLYAQPNQGKLSDCPSLLLQKWTAPEFSAVVAIDFSALRPGDLAGLISFGREYTAIALEKTEDGQVRLVQISGSVKGTEKKEQYGYVGGWAIRLGIQVRQDGTGQFYVPDLMGVWRPAGEEIVFTPGVWVGAKLGLFAVSSSAAGMKEERDTEERDGVPAAASITKDHPETEGTDGGISVVIGGREDPAREVGMERPEAGGPAPEEAGEASALAREEKDKAAIPKEAAADAQNDGKAVLPGSVRADTPGKNDPVSGEDGEAALPESVRADTSGKNEENGRCADRGSIFALDFRMERGLNHLFGEEEAVIRDRGRRVPVPDFPHTRQGAGQVQHIVL